VPHPAVDRAHRATTVHCGGRAGAGLRIKLDSPSYGIGCATVDYGGTGDGLLLAARPCDDARADQAFTLEAVSAPAAGYRLHSVPGGGLCIGVYLASRDPV
jgi:hypothetical protein